MTNFIINGLVFVVIPLGIYFVLGWLVFYHLKTYGLQGDNVKKVASIFAFIVVIISMAIIVTFISIDWDAGSAEDFFMKSSQMLNEQYER